MDISLRVGKYVFSLVRMSLYAICAIVLVALWLLSRKPSTPTVVADSSVVSPVVSQVVAGPSVVPKKPTRMLDPMDHTEEERATMNVDLWVANNPSGPTIDTPLDEYARLAINSGTIV